MVDSLNPGEKIGYFHSWGPGKEKSRIHKFFTDQKINKKISKKKLDYDKQIEFPLFNNFDNKENENEEETYQKLYNKLVDLIYIKEDFENLYIS